MPARNINNENRRRYRSRDISYTASAIRARIAERRARTAKTVRVGGVIGVSIRMYLGRSRYALRHKGDRVLAELDGEPVSVTNPVNGALVIVRAKRDVGEDGWEYVDYYSFTIEAPYNFNDFLECRLKLGLGYFDNGFELEEEEDIILTEANRVRELWEREIEAGEIVFAEETLTDTEDERERLD